MGATTSISTLESKDKIKTDVNDLLNYLLSQHIENFLDKSFCKKTKLFIKDKVFMKQAEDDIKDLSKEIFIGHEISDLSKKKELCDKLANYYLKKLNLVSSIDYTLKFYYEKLDKLQSGPFCFDNNKKKISTLEYNSQFNKATIVKFKNNQSLQLPQKNNIKITDIDIRKEAYDLFLNEIKKKKSKNYISDLANKNFLITELNKNQCSKYKHQWIDKNPDMISHDLIPNPKLTEYNKNFKYLIDKIVQYMDNKTKELFNILSKIIDREGKGKYIDKAISDNEMTNIVNSAQYIIKNIFVEINKTIFLVTNANFITNNILLKQKELELKQGKLQEELQSSKKIFNDSNI